VKREKLKPLIQGVHPYTAFCRGNSTARFLNQHEGVRNERQTPIPEDECCRDQWKRWLVDGADSWRAAAVSSSSSALRMFRTVIVLLHAMIAEKDTHTVKRIASIREHPPAKGGLQIFLLGKLNLPSKEMQAQKW
jgi:hypothetical protein